MAHSIKTIQLAVSVMFDSYAHAEWVARSGTLWTAQRAFNKWMDKVTSDDAEWEAAESAFKTQWNKLVEAEDSDFPNFKREMRMFREEAMA